MRVPVLCSSTHVGYLVIMIIGISRLAGDVNRTERLGLALFNIDKSKWLVRSVG